MRALVLADTNTLNDVVDFPTLRANLKDDLRTAIVARADDADSAGIFTFEQSLTAWRLVHVWGDRLASTAKAF